MCHVVNKIQKKTGNWGPGPWNSETVELRNYGTGTVAVELWNYSEITPKLWTGTKVFRINYGTPKPWDSETMACYSPLLVLVYWSVSQDPPPGRLKTSNERISCFTTSYLRRIWMSYKTDVCLYESITA